MQEENRIWIDPESVPPMLQESAGGWHTLMKPGTQGTETTITNDVMVEIRGLLQRMKEHLSRDRYKEATEAHQQLLVYLQKHPGICSIHDADTYAELAEAYFRIGNYDQAAECVHRGWNLKLDEYPHCETWEEYLDLGRDDWTFQSLLHTENQLKARREAAGDS